MSGSLGEFLGWIGAHPGWALLFLFLGSLLDAIFIIGVFVPAGLVLFAIGALVALGNLDFWTCVLIAAAGALCGDGLSFLLGRRYRERLFDWRLLRRNPELVRNGRAFFARHGGKGVMLARFLGPMRAILPAVAGAADMRPWVFVLADSVAALLWAIAYIVPGMVFGASLGLAAEVAGRLAVVVLGLVMLVWLGLWLARVSVMAMSAHAERWVGALLDWSHRHRRLGKLGAALTDPDQPETPVLALLALSLFGLGALWLTLWASPALHPFPHAWDAAIFQALRDLHTPWGIALATALLQLGEWPAYAPLALAVFLALLARRKTRAAAHWAAALGFGAVISLGLHAIPTLAAPHVFFSTPSPGGFHAGDLVLAAVIYAFLPVLLSTQRPLRVRAAFYGVCSVLILLIGGAQLYLGALWWSHAVFWVLIAVVWSALLGLGYRRHQPERVFARGFLLPVLGTFLIAAALQWSRDVPTPAPRHTVLQVLDSESWWTQDYARFPPQRADISGRPKQPLNLQWAGTLAEIEARLRAQGWESPPAVGGINMLRWLTASTPVQELPLLPQVHAGNHQALMLRRPLDDERQWLIRLWPSGYRLSNGEPLWLGNLSRLQVRSHYTLWRYPVAESTPQLPADILATLDAAQRAAGEVWLLDNARPQLPDS